MNTKEIVDKLGKIRLQKAKIDKAEKELAETIKRLGKGSYRGISFAALVYDGSRAALDMKALCKAFEIADEDLKRFTKDTDYICVKTTALA